MEQVGNDRQAALARLDEKEARARAERDSWAAIGGGNPHTLALAAQARLEQIAEQRARIERDMIRKEAGG